MVTKKQPYEILVYLWCPSHGSEMVRFVYPAKLRWPVRDGWVCLLYCGCTRYESLDSMEYPQLVYRWRLEDPVIAERYALRYTHPFGSFAHYVLDEDEDEA